MYKRIKELSKEAETYARSICNSAGNYLNKETGEVKIFWQISREKFAELIVRECAEVAADCDALDIYEEIREHFGVSDV